MLLCQEIRKHCNWTKTVLNQKTSSFRRNEGRSESICSTTYSSLYSAIYSKGGTKVCKAQLGCELTVPNRAEDTHHTPQLWWWWGFYVASKPLNTFSNQKYIALIFNQLLTSTDSVKGTFSTSFPQSNWKN